MFVFRRAAVAPETENRSTPGCRRSAPTMKLGRFRNLAPCTPRARAVAGARELNGTTIATRGTSHGGAYEPRSSTRVHESRLRVRRGALPRSGDEPRGELRGGEGHGVPPSRASSQPHGHVGAAPRRGASRLVVTPRRNCG